MPTNLKNVCLELNFKDSFNQRPEAIRMAVMPAAGQPARQS